MRDYCTYVILTCHGNHISGYEFDGPWYLLNMARQCANVSDKMAFVLHDAQCRDQKRDHWFTDHHNDIMVPVETFWRWKFFDGNLQELRLQSPPRHFGPPVLDEWMIPIPQPFSASAARRAPHAPLSNLATCLRAARRGHDGGKRRGIHMWKVIREGLWLERCYCYGN